MVKLLDFPVCSTLWSHGPEFPHDLLGASLTRASVCVCVWVSMDACLCVPCCKQGCKQARASKEETQGKHRGNTREHNFRKFTNCLKSHRTNASHHIVVCTMVHTTYNWSESQASGYIISSNRCSVLESLFTPPAPLFLLSEMLFFRLSRLQRKGSV